MAYAYIQLVHREAIIHSQLNHLNILPFLGIYHEDDESYPFTIFPFVERGSLERLLNTLEPHRLMEPQDLLVGTARGVAYLHSRSPPIIHGDIHSGNILIQESGNPLLCDFGRSRIRHEISRGSNREEGGRLRFLAPELSNGRTERFCSTQESDIFALAMTFLNAWSGELPFSSSKNERQIVKEVIESERPLRPASVVALEPETEQEFWSLLGEMWAQDAAERPSSGQTLERLGRIFNDCELLYHFALVLDMTSTRCL
ncbi:kinase-like protein [Clavulina sp. PMI_390]|nr:kinase-like protein [Clavulina sp. PMI_390]